MFLPPSYAHDTNLSRSGEKRRAFLNLCKGQAWAIHSSTYEAYSYLHCVNVETEAQSA
jgi:hypothetical protein